MLNLNIKNGVRLDRAPLQIAGYRRTPCLLLFFLSLGFDSRTKKRRGGVSLESNSVHISVKRDFLEGIEIILDPETDRKISLKGPKRLIDEKNHLKQTPWILANENFRHNNGQGTAIVEAVGRYRPSS